MTERRARDAPCCAWPGLARRGLSRHQQEEHSDEPRRRLPGACPWPARSRPGCRRRGGPTHPPRPCTGSPPSGPVQPARQPAFRRLPGQFATAPIVAPPPAGDLRKCRGRSPSHRRRLEQDQPRRGPTLDQKADREATGPSPSLIIPRTEHEGRRGSSACTTNQNALFLQKALLRRRDGLRVLSVTSYFAALPGWRENRPAGGRLSGRILCIRCPGVLPSATLSPAEAATGARATVARRLMVRGTRTELLGERIKSFQSRLSEYSTLWVGV